MFARAAFILSLAASTLATVFMTSPTANTVCNGGSTCNIAWQDDGNTPSLADFGTARVSIYVGSQTQQTELQVISAGVNVSTTSAIQFTVNPSIGPSGDFYFVRFQSLSANVNNVPAEAFSAKFTLNNMSGQFSASVSAQIAAAESSGSGSAAASSTGSSSAAASTTASLTTSHASSATSSGTAASATKSAASGAGRNVAAVGAAGFAGLLAAFVAL